MEIKRKSIRLWMFAIIFGLWSAIKAGAAAFVILGFYVGAFLLSCLLEASLSMNKVYFYIACIVAAVVFIILFVDDLRKAVKKARRLSQSPIDSCKLGYFFLVALSCIILYATSHFI